MRSETKECMYKRPKRMRARKGPQLNPVQLDQMQNALLKETAKTSGSVALDRMAALRSIIQKRNWSLKELFQNTDKNKNNLISLTELRKMFEDIGLPVDNLELTHLFNQLDSDNNNKVDMREFIDRIDDRARRIEKKKTMIFQSKRTLNSLPSFNLNDPTLRNPSNVMGDLDASIEPAPVTARTQNRRDTVRRTFTHIGTSEEEAIKTYNKFIDSVELTKEDYFMGRKTVLNDPIKALKVCRNLVLEIEKKPQNKQYFEDDDFGPKKTDINGYASICYPEKPFCGCPHALEIEWNRLQDICPNMNPEFVIDGANATDVSQGIIGNCWVISALSVLASDDRLLIGSYRPELENLTESVVDQEAKGLFNGVYPPIFHQFKRYGIYVLRFYKNFAWRYVIIDDQLPCHANRNPPELMMVKPMVPNEFWGPLIEKAYAKLHGNYQALISGDISDALVDFTGYVSEKINIHYKERFNTKKLKSKEAFWEKLTKLKKHHTLMGCSVQTRTAEKENKVVFNNINTGLVNGHAYSIQNLLTITNSNGQTTNLVRIRNPWGYMIPREWTGAWSDSSEELLLNWEAINEAIKTADQEEAELIDLDNKNDGLFFMDYEDFIQIFSKVSLCIKFPPEYEGRRWIREWTREQAGGTPYANTPAQLKSWCLNPQFYFRLTRPSTVFISLSVEDGRLKATSEETFPFSEHIFKLLIMVMKGETSEGGKTKLQFDQKKIIKMTSITPMQQVSLELDLEPGEYVTIPSTQETGQCAPFFLSLYHNQGEGMDCHCIDDGETPQLIAEEEEESQEKVPPQIRGLVKLERAKEMFG